MHAKATSERCSFLSSQKKALFIPVRPSSHGADPMGSLTLRRLPMHGDGPPDVFRSEMATFGHDVKRSSLAQVGTSTYNKGRET